MIDMVLVDAHCADSLVTPGEITDDWIATTWARYSMRSWLSLLIDDLTAALCSRAIDTVSKKCDRLIFAVQL
jgi:hypothetical protein